jgi:hypothetical protein
MSPERLRFVLVDDVLDGVRHCLGAEMSGGPTLCGRPERAGGWEPRRGFTSRTDQIGCDDCRALARELIEAPQPPVLDVASPHQVRRAGSAVLPAPN